MSLQSNIINWGSNPWDKVQSALSNEFVMKETTGHFNVAARIVHATKGGFSHQWPISFISTHLPREICYSVVRLNF